MPPPPRPTLFPYTTLFRSWLRGPRPTRASDKCGRGANPFRCRALEDRKSTRLNSSHRTNSYAVFCLKKKNADFLVVTLIVLNTNVTAKEFAVRTGGRTIRY